MTGLVGISAVLLWLGGLSGNRSPTLNRYDCKRPGDHQGPPAAFRLNTFGDIGRFANDRRFMFRPRYGSKGARHGPERDGAARRQPRDGQNVRKQFQVQWHYVSPNDGTTCVDKFVEGHEMTGFVIPVEKAVPNAIRPRKQLSGTNGNDRFPAFAAITSPGIRQLAMNFKIWPRRGFCLFIYLLLSSGTVFQGVLMSH